MHAKCIYKLCSLLSLIPTHLHVIRFYIDVLHCLRGFSIDPPYLVYKSIEHETPVLRIFNFQRPSGTQTELGFFWHTYFSLGRNMKRRSKRGGSQGSSKH
jgi:hypothetical protein